MEMAMLECHPLSRLPFMLLGRLPGCISDQELLGVARILTGYILVQMYQLSTLGLLCSALFALFSTLNL